MQDPVRPSPDLWKLSRGKRISKLTINNIHSMAQALVLVLLPLPPSHPTTSLIAGPVAAVVLGWETVVVPVFVPAVVPEDAELSDNILNFHFGFSAATEPVRPVLAPAFTPAYARLALTNKSCSINAVSLGFEDKGRATAKISNASWVFHSCFVREFIDCIFLFFYFFFLS